MIVRPSSALAASRPDARHRAGWAALPLLGAGLIWAVSAMPGAAQDADLIEAHAVSTFGELRYGPDAPHLDYVNPDAPKGGEMSFSWSSGGGTFDSIHPYTEQGTPDVLSSVFFESMLETTADTIGENYCLLCESVAYPEDRSYVIFTIREEARFSDGSPVTADDALFSYEIQRDEGLASFRANLPLTIASAEVVSERQIRFDFNPEAPLRGRIESAGGLPIISRASHEASGRDFDESRLEPLIGSGPYLLDEIAPGRRTIYARNPEYWGADLWINQGRHNFDTIRIEYYADGIAAFEGFTAGNYTFRQENSSQNWATAYDFPKLEQGLVVREQLPDGTMAPGQAFSINLRRPQLQDERVREAIALMFNFEWTNQTLFYGLYAPVHSFVENSELEPVGPPSPEELAILEPFRGQIPDRVFTEDPFTLPASNPDRSTDRRNGRRAQALLDEAGWEVGADGMRRNAQGQTLEVEFLNAGALFNRIINPYVENLRSIGVDARLTTVDGAQMRQRQTQGDFDMLTDFFSFGYEPSTGLRQFFGSIGADQPLFNSMGLEDPAVDALIETVIRSETRDEMITAARALDRVLRAKVVRVGQWFNDSHWVSYYDMYRYPEELPPFALGFLDFWWVDAEAEAELRAAGAF